MKSVFNKIFISNHEILFWGFILVIILMIIITVILVGKEVKKSDDNK